MRITVTHVKHDGRRAGSKQRSPRFGFRVPAAGMPVPFRVLVSTRWLASGTVLALILLVTLVRTPQRRLPVLKSLVIMGLTAIIAAVAEARRLRFELVTVPIPDLPAGLDGLKVVQLTDLHLGSLFSVRKLRAARAWVARVQPDIVALTGDFVGDAKHIVLLHEGLRGISARYGVYAVLGNHDYWTNIPAIEQVLEEHGVVLLRNERRLIDAEGTPLQLVGVDCVWEQLHDVSVAMRDHAPGTTIIVLVHEPDAADEIAPYGAVLQLSGHTHAGHFTLPWLGPAFLPRHGFNYFRGLLQVGSMWVYVSRGLGGFPLRLGSPPEATLFILRRG